MDMDRLAWGIPLDGCLSARSRRRQVTKQAMHVILVVAWLSTGCVATPANSPARGEVNLQVLFQIAAKRETARLLELEATVGASPDPILSVGLPIALYVADPGRFAQRFIESFPTTYGELMYGLYAIEIAGVLPQHAFFSIRTLGQFARSGNATATRKLLLAIPHSDGVIAEALFEELTQLLLTRPKNVLPAFALLIGPERASILQSVRVLLSTGPGPEIAKSLRSLKDLPDAERIAADALIRALEGTPE